MKNFVLRLVGCILFLGGGLMLSGCVSLFGSKHTYQGGGSEVSVNGAKISMLVKPEGTKPGSIMFTAMVVGAGRATLDGPFAWRIEAEGKEGVHESIEVTRIYTSTTLSKLSEEYPSRWLEGRADFVKKRSYPEGVVKAIRQIPGQLAVKPEEDGALDILVDIVVVTNQRRVKERIKFRLDPTKKSNNQTIFIPAEIVTHVGKPMSEWEDKGWDR